MREGAHAEKGDDARAVAAELGGELRSTGHEFSRRKLVRCGGRAVDEIGDAVAKRNQFSLLGWMQDARRKACRMQRGPEAIARAREMMAGRTGVQPRIDPDEEDAQAGRDDIDEALPLGRRELLGAGPRRDE